MNKRFADAAICLIRACWRDRGGAAVVEFAVYGPILIFGCMAMVDLGRATYEKMALAEVVRVGASSAMANAEPAAIEQHMKATAEGEFVIAGDGSSDDTINTSTAPLKLTARRYCACPESPTVELDECTSMCANSAPPSIFVRLDAAKPFNGLILPSFSLTSRNDVQVR